VTRLLVVHRLQYVRWRVYVIKKAAIPNRNHTRVPVHSNVAAIPTAITKAGQIGLRSNSLPPAMGRAGLTTSPIGVFHEDNTP
jgi:hypothetical protein